MTSYTRRNFRAVVEALVPRTPALESSHGEAYVPGGPEVALEEYVVEAFDEYQEHHHGYVSVLLRRLGVRNYPYAIVVAFLLDLVAVELLLRRRNRDRVSCTPGLSGPFARLSETDRLRAIDLLENGAFGTLTDRFGHRVPHLGMVQFLAMGLNTFPMLGYYSEWSADGDGAVQGWSQTGYPGPAAGYTAHHGYEVEAFEE